MPSPIEKRFGSTNIKTVAIVCSGCGAIASISTNKSRALPPSIIVKKLTRVGWRIDGNPKHDLCYKCSLKPIQGKLSLAAKALTDLAAPMVGDKHFSELKAIARTLGPDQAKELIAILRERIPTKPKPEPRKKAEPMSRDADYEQWLKN